MQANAPAPRSLIDGGRLGWLPRGQLPNPVLAFFELIALPAEHLIGQKLLLGHILPGDGESLAQFEIEIEQTQELGRRMIDLALVEEFEDLSFQARFVTGPYASGFWSRINSTMAASL